MSKIGKKNILVPKDSSVKSENGIITITGPKGSKTLSINEKIFSSSLNERIDADAILDSSEESFELSWLSLNLLVEWFKRIPKTKLKQRGQLAQR